MEDKKHCLKCGDVCFSEEYIDINNTFVPFSICCRSPFLIPRGFVHSEDCWELNECTEDCVYFYEILGLGSVDSLYNSEEAHLRAEDLIRVKWLEKEEGKRRLMAMIKFIEKKQLS